jgi:hypothetical protein
VLHALSDIPRVTAIKVEREDAAPQPIAPPQSIAEASAAMNRTLTLLPEGTLATGVMLLQTGILPEGHLFKPLLADPRWAHFSAAYRNYVGNNIDGNNNGAVSFGETIPFYRANLGRYAAQWEVGLQAAVFSDFNLARHRRA